MKLRNFLVILVALVFVFVISCKERGEDEEQENASLKARGQVVEKAESEEAEEGEEGEEAEEQEAKQMKVELPAAVAKAVTDNVPGAEIDILTVEKEGGISLYDIEFKAGMGEIEVAGDGTVMDVSKIIDMEDVPRAAAEAIQKAVEGGMIKQIEKSEVRAEIKMDGETGTIVKLDTPRYVYEAEFTKDGRTAEIQVAPDGTVVEATKWVDEEAGEKEEGEESEEGEEAEEAERKAAPVVDLKILPAAVLEAFKTAYPQAVIKGTDKETENGVTYYEIESDDGGMNRNLLYTADGKVFEIEEAIAPDALPDAVLQALGKAYPGYKILQAEVTTEGGKIYELQIEVDGKKMAVSVDPSGKIIK